METIEEKIRFFAENSKTRREYDEHVDQLIEDIFRFGGCEVRRLGKVFREDAVAFCLWTNSSYVGSELKKIIEKPTIRRYFCFAGESENTVKVPTVEDFREMVEDEVLEFAFHLF